jgi:hypothetical protein
MSERRFCRDLATALQEEYLVGDVHALGVLSGVLALPRVHLRGHARDHHGFVECTTPQDGIRVSFPPPCYPNQHLAQGVTGDRTPDPGPALYRNISKDPRK